MSTLYDKISHHSASQINMAKSCMAAYLVCYGMGIRDGVNPAMVRGRAAEAAVEYGLTEKNKTAQDVADQAAKQFDAETPRRMSIDESEVEKWQRERDIAQRCAVSAFEFIQAQDWGPLTDCQVKCSYNIAGIPKPIVGFTDFTFAESGLVVDLKCVGRAQNKPADHHSLQIAGYAVAQSNYQQALLYAFPKAKTSKDEHAARFFKISDETVDEQLRIAAHTCHAIKKLLSLSDSVDEISQYITPNFDSFYLTGKVRDAAIGLFSKNYK